MRSAVREVRGAHLLAPAREAFLHRPLLPPASDAAALGVTAANLDALAATAAAMLEAGLEAAVTTVPLPADDERTRSVALQYAERVVRQREIREDFDAAAADPSSLHAQVTEHARTRLYEYALQRNGRRLDTRVRSWRRSVDRVTHGAAWLTPEEYVDMLAQRDALAQIRSMLLPPAQRLLEERIASSDEAFAAGTRPVAAALRQQERWSPVGWWWYRIPREVSDSFRRYFGLAAISPPVQRG